MKSRMYHKSIRRNLLRSTAVLAILLTTASCVRDRYEPQAGNPDGRALVALSISSPSATAPKAAVKGPDEDENRVTSVKVLVFEKEGGDYYFKYMEDGRQYEQVGFSQTRFSVLLMSTPQPLKLVLAANSDDYFSHHTLEPNVTRYEDLKNELILPFGGGLAVLPMYGEIDLPGGIDATKPNDYSVMMLRGVARADVVKDLEPDSYSFRMEEIYVYRANDRVQLIPSYLDWGGYPRVTDASVPPGAAPLMQPVRKMAEYQDPRSIEGIYVSESQGEQTPTANQSACLVVGGYFDNKPTMSYYRINFDPNQPGHPSGQILRNHKYIFIIRKVTADGWNNPEAAAYNEPTSIVAEVLPWDVSMTDMFFDGENHLGVSSRELVFEYKAGQQQRINVSASLPYSIQWLNGKDGPPTGPPIVGFGVLNNQEHFTARKIEIPGPEPGASCIEFETRTDNRTDEDREAWMRVTAGRWTFDIKVIQKPRVVSRDKIIRVLSTVAVGDLGTVDKTDASGRPLRYILDNRNNFSMTGTCPVNGFVFTRIPYNGIVQATAGTDEFEAIKNLFYSHDVVMLSYNCRTSADVAAMAKQWVTESKNRVLIVFTDSNSTNAALLALLTEDGTWTPYSTVNIGGNYQTFFDPGRNGTFYNGDFGMVASRETVLRADNVAAYNSNYPPWVTPILFSNKAGYENCMVMGVNERDGIVYHGDGSLNLVPYMSSSANVNGTVTNEFDRLQANLWAWIVERVCEGE